MTLNELPTHLFYGRHVLIPGDETATIDMCAKHFVLTCQEAIQKKGSFFVALAGGSTPKAVYHKITASPYSKQIEWDKVFLFWGDERNIAPTDSESNYKMAMEAGFNKVGLDPNHIFRMPAETDLEKNALAYEKLLTQVLKNACFDLILLGMGEDGHTASLFPGTQGLTIQDRLVIANYVPEKKVWRMSLTFQAINAAKQIAIYVIGAPKKHILFEVFHTKEDVNRFPIQNVKKDGTLWIVDQAASSELTA